MIREIITYITNTGILNTSSLGMYKDISCLEREDVQKTIKDLVETAQWFEKKCVGLSANQINEFQPIFVFKVGKIFVPVINPKVVAISREVASGPEGCLSLPGIRPKKIRRHKWITLKYYDDLTKSEITRKFKGFEARIIQHEMDHIRGILV